MNYREIIPNYLSGHQFSEPESVLGQLKNNRGFRRFLLRGMEKMKLGVVWLSLVYNVLKQAAKEQTRKVTLLKYPEKRSLLTFVIVRMIKITPQ
ncbi:transposase [Paenibacillus sp. FSL R10-2734]|uniref:transposase n=1 Tax=Paenibacillus sp. FSL R10-2734 TaxID=2954691 RepID=UPI0030DCA73E